MTKPTRGTLITLEGGEGGGKTTQLVRLKDRLLKAGHDVLAVREPGGTTISEQIREVVLSPKNVGMAFTTEVLLFQAARAQIYRELVIPSLEVGKVVLMDRSRDSSVVYQGLVRGFGTELINQLNDISTKQTMPDITVLLDVNVEIGLKRRVESGKQDRIDMENVAFHHQVRQSYLDLAKADKSGRWQVVDANQSIDEVEKRVWQVVEGRLGK